MPNWLATGSMCSAAQQLLGLRYAAAGFMNRSTRLNFLSAFEDKRDAFATNRKFRVASHWLGRMLLRHPASARANLPGAVRSQRCLYLLQAALQCGARAGKINAHKARAARPKGIAIVGRHMRMLNEKVVRCGL